VNAAWWGAYILLTTSVTTKNNCLVIKTFAKYACHEVVKLLKDSLVEQAVLVCRYLDVCTSHCHLLL